MTIYRQIYEHHFGPIPKGYHIHHKDGNKANNDINNLQCVTAQEHYDIHKSQGDYGACWAMVVTGHISISPEERSLLVRQQQNELVKQGKHPWLTREDGTSVSFDRKDHNSKIVSKTQKKLVEAGKHHFLKENRDSEMDSKKSKTLKKRYEDPTFKEYKRISSLGRTWKLNEEQKKKVTAHLTFFDKDTAKVCKNTIWINDGVKNKRIKSTEAMPEGFTEGRLFTPWNKGKKKNV